MGKILNTEKVIEQFKNIHGDKYDYTLVNYKSGNIKIKIICKEHGEFEQTPTIHKTGHGCPKCKGSKQSKKLIQNTKEVINDFKKIHGNKYDYSFVDYTSPKKMIKIICSKHGIFEQHVQAHKNGSGCPICKGTKQKNRLTLSQNKVIEQFKEVHGNKYDYSIVEYVSNKEKVKIICKKHGIFEQTPESHKKGKGCKDCSNRPTLNTEKIKKFFKEIHGDKYDYSLVNYINNITKIKIRCIKHGIYEQTPQSHRNGNGCSLCHKEKIKIEKPKIKKIILSPQINKEELSKYKLKRNNFFESNLEKRISPKITFKIEKRISPKITTESIIKDFKDVHGNKYDYSLVNYVNSTTKVKILCDKHGVFEQSPVYHKKGSNCPKCKNRKSGLSQEEIIKRFKKVHGDRYDYSLVELKKIKENVKIICKEHGIFEQAPSSHFRGMGCPKCVGQNLTQEDIIKEFKKNHGERYDYSKVKVINHKTKVEIICKKHGSFFQSIYHHKTGSNCKKCINLKYDTENIIKEFRKIHGNLYDYSKTKFTSSKDKVKVICKEHGEFLINPILHKSGSKCPICSNVRIKLTTKEVIEQFKETHKERYDYSKVKYINGEHKIKIICKEHGVFEQLPWNHKNGSNCPICMQNTGYKFNLPGILYYIRINNNGRIGYKIGITNRSVKERFSGEMKYITIIREWLYYDGEECYNQEQKILKEFEYAKLKGNNLLRDGNTEMFDRDILLLDN